VNGKGRLRQKIGSLLIDRKRQAPEKSPTMSMGMEILTLMLN